MATNIEMNVKQESDYEVIYPQTICDMVINLLNPDTKELMGLEPTADADDAFRKVYLAQVLDGRALINFTVMGDDGTPCKGVQIESAQFCDANGNKEPVIETNDEGKVSIFVDALSVTVEISGYANLNDWSTTYEIVYGEQYDKEVTLTRVGNYRDFTSSGTFKFNKDIVRVDVCCGGAGGNGASGWGTPSAWTAGPGGAGGYVKTQEQVSFEYNQDYSLVLGTSGGNSSFLGVIGNGGNSGNNTQDYFNREIPGAIGNGNGGSSYGTYTEGQNRGASGGPGTAGTGSRYISFTESSQSYGGGGGGGGCSGRTGSLAGGAGAGFGGRGGSGEWTEDRRRAESGYAGTDGYGGGGGGGGGYQNMPGYGGAGGKGCVAIRMYRQQDLS